MTASVPAYASVDELLRLERPARPVYCVHPDIYRQAAAEFVAAFPGRTLYAVKANDHSLVIRALRDGGIRHFDCASLDEIEAVRAVDGAAACYFMVPTRLRGAAREAQQRHGVRHFLVDHPGGITALAAEIEMRSSVVFARMAVSHASAMQDLSSKFGAPPADIPELLGAIADAGAEPALAFNVGSSVRSPDAYRHAIGVAATVLNALPYRLYGPTCDSTDVLPAAIDLPDGIRPGDYLHFERIGAYSLSGRTDFNGHYSDRVVIVGDTQAPAAVATPA